VTAALASPMLDEAWGPLSDPTIMGQMFVKKFSELPRGGMAGMGTRFWSGDYWPLRKGSINYRWNADRPSGFNLVSPSKEEIMYMSEKELEKLAPSEKYDIFVGRYDYPLKNEVALVADKKADDWKGICHGWAPASINHNEPTPKTLLNPDGIPVPFGSADIKALLSYYYAYGFQVDNTHQMGRRCYDENGRETDCETDLNAGAFHIVLANKIGIEKVGFVADMDPGKEVWNQPVHSYESVVLKEINKPGRNAAPGTVQTLLVKTTITYIDESENYWNKILGTPFQKEQKATFKYEVELDKDGIIIGGHWKSRNIPDFLWVKRRPFIYEGNLSRLGELLND
jgi:hypothetical protein